MGAACEGIARHATMATSQDQYHVIAVTSRDNAPGPVAPALARHARDLPTFPGTESNSEWCMKDCKVLECKLGQPACIGVAPRCRSACLTCWTVRSSASAHPTYR